MLDNSEQADTPARASPLSKRLISTWRWLTQPTKALSESEERRVHLLTWILLFLIFLSLTALFLVFLFDPPDGSRRRVYIWLILGLIALLTFAYVLNRAGHYSTAAALTVACAITGPWGSVVFDAAVLQGDFVPLTYVSLTILLSSMLLPPITTILLAGIQLLALGLLPLFNFPTTSINWPSLVAMIFFTAILSIVANLIQQRDINLIESHRRQLEHLNTLTYALTHITTQIEKELSEETIIQRLGEELDKVGFTCTIALYDQGQRLFTINYSSMTPKVLEQMEAGLGFQLIGSTFPLKRLNSILKIEESLQPVVVSKPATEIQVLFTERREHGVAEILLGIGLGPEAELLRSPLVFEEKLLGMLWLWGQDIHKTDLAILSIFSKQVGISLERMRLFQEIQSQALTDPLTGLQNRRSLFELGKIEFSRADRMKRPFCCLMLDLDHFKQINDRYGHLTGDQVVQEFARRCSSSVRDVDLIGRYGGEEILIFLPETVMEKAVQIAERLRAHIAEIPMCAQLLHITVSIGVSQRDEHTLALETLIARADQAMYVAKHKGRNRVEISI